MLLIVFLYKKGQEQPNSIGCIICAIIPNKLAKLTNLKVLLWGRGEFLSLITYKHYAKRNIHEPVAELFG